MNLLVTEQRLSAATLPQTPTRKRRPKTSHIKYGMFFVMIFMMITAVKVYLNYANIQQNITDVKAKIIQRQRDMDYLEIQNAYYRSPYAEKLTAHQQGILLPGEQFVLFEYVEPIQEEKLAQTGENLTGVQKNTTAETSLRPLPSRKAYFQAKMDTIP